MKKLFITLIAATLMTCCCNKSNQFKVNLNLDNAENQTVYLYKAVDGNNVCIDSTVIVGNTAVLTADFDDPQIAYILKFDKNEICGVYSFFTENQNTTITGDREDMPHWTIKGCHTMDILMAYHEKAMKLYEEPLLALFAKMNDAAMNGDTLKAAEIEAQFLPLMDEYHNYQADFIKSQSDNYLGHYMLDLCKMDFDIEVVKELFKGFTNESIYSKNVKEYIEKYERGEVEMPSCMIID